MTELTRVRWDEAEESKEWDDFVKEYGGSLFHLWSWKKVLESDNSRSLYLGCRDPRGKLVAICPFFYKRAGRLFYLDSLPLSSMAGPVVSTQANNVPQILESLRKSVRFSPFKPVVSMKIRTHQPPIVRSLDALGFRYTAPDGLFILNLQEKSPEYIWNNEFVKHDRQAVKYYDLQGSKFRFATNDLDFDKYLGLHEESVARGKEKPVIPPGFLTRMRLNLGDRLKVGLVTRDDKIIAGFSMICDPVNSIVHLALIGYSREKNIHSPIIYIDWKAINWASENGYRYVNLGPTNSDPSNAVYKLKSRLGGTFILRYRFTLPTSKIIYSFGQKIIRTARILP